MNKVRGVIVAFGAAALVAVPVATAQADTRVDAARCDIFVTVWPSVGFWTDCLK